MNEDYYIFILIQLKFKGPIDNDSIDSDNGFVQRGDKPLYEPLMDSFIDALDLGEFTLCKYFMENMEMYFYFMSFTDVA